MWEASGGMARRALTVPLLAVLPLLAGRQGPPAGRSAARHEVEIRGMAFQPARIAIAPGDTVVWINRDIVPHTATATGRGGWDTGVIAQGGSRAWVARRNGTFAYACALHPTMQGSLVVGGGASSP